MYQSKTEKSLRIRLKRSMYKSKKKTKKILFRKIIKRIGIKLMITESIRAYRNLYKFLKRTGAKKCEKNHKKKWNKICKIIETPKAPTEVAKIDQETKRIVGTEASPSYLEY